SGACPLLIQISGTMRSKHTPHPRGDMPEPSEPAESNGRPISSQSGFKRPVNVRVPYALRTQILLYPIQVCQMRSGGIVFSCLPRNSAARISMLTVLGPALTRYEHWRPKSHFGEKHLIVI